MSSEPQDVQMTFLDEPCIVLWVVTALTCPGDKSNTYPSELEEHRELCNAFTDVSTTVLDMEIPVENSRLLRLFRAGTIYYQGSDAEFL
jgi:hypothetical protein